MRLFAGGASVAALAQMPSAALAAPAAAASKRLTLAQCQQLSPLDMAKSSRLAVAAYQFLQKSAREIENTKLRQMVTSSLQNPAPTILERYRSDADKQKVRQQLIDAKLLAPEITISQLFPPASGPAQAPQPFLGTPGSGYGSHHAYPGGLGMHVALNVRSSLGLYAGYSETNGFKLSRDVILAAQLLHDIHKPWIFQWQADGSPLTEYHVAGTGDHHILSIAESIHRGVPAEVIVALASAHDNPGAEEEKTVGYIKAAAIIAGRDPVEAGLLATSGNTVVVPRRIEGFVVFLGDHEWVVSVPAAEWAVSQLQEIAVRDYGMTDADMKTAKFNALRNYVFSQISIIGLHERQVVGGKDAVRAAVNALVAPV
jgi:hypothetical protein